MHQIKVYGMGCARCKELYQRCLQALDKAGMQGYVVEVEDLAGIITAGVLVTPGLEIDGKLVSEGRLLTVGQIVERLEAAAPA
ncbi:thioredoxin family protein [bacterium]|nr:thioredoxin family protein [bacterium]